ncbi:hypothetical protein P3T76_003060 [Phytophthora citrophthora]|uniref:F-box domain-containing protein n=1 Tax=Phytophthora citrophthora TaxID=4793 RepID=A0AAD9LSZ5_9STRA|nr:hypothetical protein P3T76_003060 [Phytophthora citrophthora]
MEHLPSPLFLSIVAFAVYDYSADPIPKRTRLPVDSLKVLAQVCKAWHSLINDIVACSKSSSLSLKFTSGKRSELLELRRRILERGPQILDLDVKFGETEWDRTDFKIEWDVFFSRLPALKRLDLSNVELLSGHVELILTSAAKYCTNIESLILSDVNAMLQGRVKVDSIFKALYAALKTWRSSGSYRGLRQLTVPILDERNRFESCKKFLDNVMKFCPEVEYLDGYKKTLRKIDRPACRDGWMVTLEQWKEFNSKCTQLREFNWVVAPFADPFFKVFGEHVKPNLKTLKFAVNMHWEWGVYYDLLAEAAGEEPPVVTYSTQLPGYGFKATDVSSALKGCPALDELEVELNHPVEYDAPYDYHTVDFPNHEVINIDIYDDKFCEAVAENCPLLTKLSIREVAGRHFSNLTPIRTFTDLGLVALTQLKHLTSLELRTINCTGNGLFEFLNDLSDEFTGERNFQIAVGGHVGDPKLAFYNALPELLMQLEARTPEELAWGNRKFVLRLTNANFADVEPAWSEQYLRGLERVVENVKKMHPTLRLRITTCGRQGSTFGGIIELGLYTDNAEPSPWYGWDGEESNRNITFVNRGGPRGAFEEERSRLPIELHHPELLDPDTLPIDYELPADYFDAYEYGGYGDYDDFDDYDDDPDGDSDDPPRGYYDAEADELWL